MKIRSPAEAEAQWTRYLEADEGSPEAFFGQVLTRFAAWVADQEMESIKRRTREGLERARQQGKTLGPPRKVNQGPAFGVSPKRSSARPTLSGGHCSGKEWQRHDLPTLPIGSASFRCQLIVRPKVTGNRHGHEK